MAVRGRQRQNLFTLRWQPTAETGFVLFSWLMVIAGLWMAFQVFTTRRVALNYITYGPITLFGLGMVLPLVWTIKKGRSLKAVGITGRQAWVSIVVGLIYATVFRLTKNVLIIWPFLTPMRGLSKYIMVGLTLPFEATYGFIIILGLMIAFTLFLIVSSSGKGGKAQA